MDSWHCLIWETDSLHNHVVKNLSQSYIKTRLSCRTSFTDGSRGGLSSHLQKKQTINSWKRNALCDSVLSYESWTCYKE